jgi:hypothetical protein
MYFCNATLLRDHKMHHIEAKSVRVMCGECNQPWNESWAIVSEASRLGKLIRCNACEKKHNEAKTNDAALSKKKVGSFKCSECYFTNFIKKDESLFKKKHHCHRCKEPLNISTIERDKFLKKKSSDVMLKKHM